MPRPDQPGEALWIGSVAVATAGARPDQAEALTFLFGEEVGEDRSGEVRIVGLETQIIAALVGALGPGGPDLHTADIDPVAGGIVARAAGFGDDADVPGLKRGLMTTDGSKLRDRTRAIRPTTRLVGRICDPPLFGRPLTTIATYLPPCRSSRDACAALSGRESHHLAETGNSLWPAPRAHSQNTSALHV